MLDERVIVLLARRNFASIATSMSNGAHQVTHVWIGYDQEHNILINSAIGRLKERNTRRDNRVQSPSSTVRTLMKQLLYWV